MGRTVSMEGVGNYSPAPSGVYGASTYTKGEWKVVQEGRKTAGSEYYKWQITLGGGDEEGEGKVVFRNWGLNSNQLFIMRGDLAALGYEEQFGEGSLDAPDFDVDAAIAWAVGKRAVVTVTERSYTYPEGHRRAGETTKTNEVDKVEQADIPEMLAPAARRR